MVYEASDPFLGLRYSTTRCSSHESDFKIAVSIFAFQKSLWSLISGFIPVRSHNIPFVSVLAESTQSNQFLVWSIPASARDSKISPHLMET
jgi:hypothetical protein